MAMLDETEACLLDLQDTLGSPIFFITFCILKGIAMSNSLSSFSTSATALWRIRLTIARILKTSAGNASWHSCSNVSKRRLCNNHFRVAHSALPIVRSPTSKSNMPQRSCEAELGACNSGTLLRPCADPTLARESGGVRTFGVDQTPSWYR